MNRFSYLLTAFALACFLFAGCGETANDGGNQNQSSQGDHDDDHDHGHGDHGHGDHGHDHDDEDHADHSVGPNGGHVYALTPGDYQLEWAHYRGSHKNDFFILDAEGKENVAVKADSFSVTNNVGENETFTLDAVEPNEQGETAKYSLDQQELSVAMTLGVTVEIKIGDKTFTTKIDAHEPHDH